MSVTTAQFARQSNEDMDVPQARWIFFPIPSDIYSSLDFLELESCKGRDGKKYNYIFVLICRLSGYIVAIPCQKAGLTAVSLAQIFLEKYVCFMGLPNEIVSDQDHLISSKFFSTLCGLIGIDFL